LYGECLVIERLV